MNHDFYEQPPALPSEQAFRQQIAARAIEPLVASEVDLTDRIQTVRAIVAEQPLENLASGRVHDPVEAQYVANVMNERMTKAANARFLPMAWIERRRARLLGQVAQDEYRGDPAHPRLSYERAAYEDLSFLTIDSLFGRQDTSLSWSQQAAK